MSVSFKLAWRYLWGRKLRTFLTTLAVIFGVMLIFGLNGMLPGMIDAFNRMLLGAAGQVDLSVTSASSGYFDSSIVDKVRNVNGVAAATPSLRRTVGMPTGSALGTVMVVGIEPRSARKVHDFQQQSGRFLAGSDRGVVVIGTDTAGELGLRLGSKLTIPSVAGTRSFEVIGLLGNASSPGASEIYMSLADAGMLVGQPGKVSTVEGRFVTGVDRAAVESRVRRALGSDYTVGGLSTESQLLASLKVGQFSMTMFGVFALIMGGFIILNTFRTLVSERRHDIGMLRAIGARRRTILGVFLVQSLVQGVLGTALGLLAGWGLALLAVNALVPIWRTAMHMDVTIKPVFTPGNWAVSIILGMGVTILGAIIPARQAANITPLEAMRPQMAEVADRGHKKLVLVGWTLLAVSVPLLFITGNTSAIGMGAVLFLIGMILVAPALIAPLSNLFARLLRVTSPATAELSSSNLTRQPGRAAATASAILISLAIVVAIIGLLNSIFAGFFSYIDKSLGSDFVAIPQGLIIGGSHVGADQNLVNEIAGTPGVGDVATLRLGAGKINDGEVQIIGVDPVMYPKVASFTYSSGTSVADVAMLGKGRTMLVNGIYSAQNGVSVGQTLQVETPNGLKDYKVVGIATDYLNAKLASTYISQDNLESDFGVTTNVLVLANAETGASIPMVKARLERLFRDYPQFILYDSKDFKDSQVKLIEAEMPIFYVLIGMLALPTLLALLNTLAISVLARTREIGMLRAVGATRRQIKGMVVAESLLLAGVGVSFGIAGGLVLGYALTFATDAMFPMPYVFPWMGIITAIISGFTFALLAALIPSRQAAKLDIVEALHYE
ncbi:MAG TPA: FtsX-like permease family protein [Coriobacteriia bacterium]|nr:FtsX-like permease family protein [Coriobacteriia bacterium]